MVGRRVHRAVPGGMVAALDELSRRGVATVALRPGGGWVVVGHDRRLRAHGIPAGCRAELTRLLDRGHRVRTIAFASGSDAWLVVSDRTAVSAGVPDDLRSLLDGLIAAGDLPRTVALAPGGGWVVGGADRFWSAGIPSECHQVLRNLHSAPTGVPLDAVAFSPGAPFGWAVAAGRFVFGRDLPAGAFDALVATSRLRWRIGSVALSRRGWVATALERLDPGAPVHPQRVFEQRVGSTVWARLRESRVPGAAVAVVDDGQIAWTGAYGMADARIGRAVGHDTVFQAASLAKPVTALGILALVDDGLISLDDDVEPHLGLPLPRHRLAGAVPRGSITVRRLLQHRAGIVGRDTTPTERGDRYRRGGGGSYRLPDRPGASLPDVVDSWFGRRGSAPAVQVTYRPGSRVSYSGAGFLVLQRLVEQLGGQPFAEWMGRRVLAPLGMTDSTFAVRSAARRWSAVGHDRRGRPLSGDRELLPWSAAGGLYATAPDLARVVTALAGLGPSIVSAELVGELRRSGLGVFVRRGGRPDEALVHTGSNGGFRSLLVAYPNRRAGVVVLTNGAAADGEALRRDLGRAAARAQGLPGF